MRTQLQLRAAVAALELGPGKAEGARQNQARGERVDVTPAGSTGGGVEVNVYAPPGSTVDEQRSQKGDIEQINLVIDSATARNMRPGTLTSRSLLQVFGNRRSLIAR